MHTLVHEQDIRDEGIAIGREQGIRELIQNALKNGMSPEDVSKILCVTSEEVSKAQEEMCEPVQ